MAARTAALRSDLTSSDVTCWRSSVIALVLAVSIAGYFWVDSRYPSLLKKYHSGTHVKVVGAITFDAVYAEDRNMPLAERVWRTTVNWLHANEVGMTFGFFFGPAALALLAIFPKRRTGNAYFNSLRERLAVCRSPCARIAWSPSGADYTLREWQPSRCWRQCSVRRR